MIRSSNTDPTTGEFRPMGISGHVSLVPAKRSAVIFFPRGREFKDVKGAKMDMAFLENSYRDCENFKGYQYLGV